MILPAGCKLMRDRRTFEEGISGRDYIDLCGPAAIVIGRDEIAFGAMQATLDIEYGPTSIAFNSVGCDEMNEVSCEGPAGFSMAAPSKSSSSTTMATRPRT